MGEVVDKRMGPEENFFIYSFFIPALPAPDLALIFRHVFLLSFSIPDELEIYIILFFLHDICKFSLI